MSNTSDGNPIRTTDRADLLGQGEAFGLPKIGDWQQIPFGSGAEYYRDDHGSVVTPEVVIGDDRDTDIKSLELPQAWLDADKTADDLSSRFAYWLNERGELRIGSPTDPFAFASETAEPPANVAVSETGGSRLAGLRPLTMIIVGLFSMMVVGLLIWMIGFRDGSENTVASNNTAETIVADSAETGSDSEDTADNGSPFGAFDGSDPIFQVTTAAAADSLVNATWLSPDQQVPAEGSSPISTGNVEVDGGRVRGSVELAEVPEGPFGVGVMLVADGLITASHFVQGSGESGAGQIVGRSMTVYSHGFENGGGPLTQTVESEQLAPTSSGSGSEAGSAMAIDLDWDLTEAEVPEVWGGLTATRLEVWIVVDLAPGSSADVAFLRVPILIGVAVVDQAIVFPSSAAIQPLTLAEARLSGFTSAGLPENTASCLVEDISVAQEVAVAFRPADQEPLLIRCLLLTQFFANAAAGLQPYTVDGTVDIECLSNGLAPHLPTVEAYLLFGAGDPAAWPDGVLPAYADALEQCVPLRPFYEALFGQYNFTDPDCDTKMADYTLGLYSWLTFLELGIFHPDAATSAAGQAKVNDDIAAGYVTSACVVQG